MTFEYSVEELGLDKKISPKFLDIRRLRPLDNDQPWGIFFIAFDETKLPVVALRRLLSKLALTKRSSSNTGERASWHANDLLLISQTGENDGRSISFAHFTSNPKKKDLPILKVLGWDSDDTGLKIDYVTKMLREKLVWPDNPADSEAWREQWRDAFTIKNREVIQSSKAMAERLGQLALSIRTRLREILAIETEEGALHKLMLIFKENLISDLDTESFSDMYAQTIAYGLLSARIINPKANTADAVHTQIPITNPFLRDLMDTFLNIGGRKNNSSLSLDFDELGINEVVDLLDNTNMEAVLLDFGDRNQKEDPVMHFFESFLEEYDSKIKKDRGVFYTPQPVVSFIVRSVDEQLRKEFGLEDGLADTTTWGEMAERMADLEVPEGFPSNQAFVQILDPATGTGTFPVEVIDLIYKTMTSKWYSEGNREAQVIELWNDYVPEHLLPRLHGYELMMAPYAIAHMKIGLKLYETGYRFESDERSRIYLTNALDSAQDFSGTLAFAIPALANEAKAVNMIKQDQRFTVVIGNPPYSHWSGNMTDQHRALVEDYKYVDGQRIRERGAVQFEINIQDDYVKFIRIAEMHIQRSGFGISGLITNNAYLDSATFRGMRSVLFRSFSSIQILNLHGSVKAMSQRSLSTGDKNVFDIQQGVCINISCLRFHTNNTLVEYKDIFGSRKEKYDLLSSSIELQEVEKLNPHAPEYFFIYRDESVAREYESGVPIDTLFNLTSSGVKTNRDKLTIAFSDTELFERAETFLDSELDSEDISAALGVEDKKYWTIDEARKNITSLDWSNALNSVHYRPFDRRRIVYHSALVHSMRKPVMSQLLDPDNLALLACRQQISPGFFHVFVTRGIFDCCFVSNRSRENTNGFPLFVQQHDGLLNEKHANMNQNVMLDLIPQGKKKQNVSELSSMNSALDLFNCIYAQLHSVKYRLRYVDFLQRGYPRVFRPSSTKLYHKLAQLGKDLIELHLMDSPKLDYGITYLSEDGLSQVDKVSYSDKTVWINEEKTRGFKGVSERVWNFQVGSYRVCEKWLKDREAKGGRNPHAGRVLTDEEIQHYQKIITTINETIRIMAEIDKTIERYGGWPDAFKS